MNRYISLLFSLIISTVTYAQQGTKASITGRVVDAVSGEAVSFATIYIDGSSMAVESSLNGRYQINVPAEESFVLKFSRIGYKEVAHPVGKMPANTSKQVDIKMVPAESQLEVIVTESKIQDAAVIREDVTQLKLLPTTTGNLESMLPQIALGASSGTGGELSSQYNVRGGNYDENLVYVNDFEIYRPQLIRAGQQEGLTFANTDLLRDLTFSSGAFEARYGDKMSSVLDVKYKRPDSLAASVEMSFLGGSTHIEGSKRVGEDGYRKFRYLAGARYKTTRYLLGSLDVTGEYQPNFADIQAYLTYDINTNWQVALMGNYNSSVYKFQPKTRSTALGLINYALQLYSVFDGQEVDDFTTTMGGTSLTYLPQRDHNPFYLKFLASNFTSHENERIDIIGQYSLREIESSLGSSNFGEVISELGAGTQHQYVRNSLGLQITNIEHKGGWEIETYPEDEDVEATHFVQWGTGVKFEHITDWLNEWERIDSAGYSLPYDTNNVLMTEVLQTRNSLDNQVLSAYLQDTWSWRKADIAEIKISGGVRFNHRTISGETTISPRIQLLYKPLASKKDVAYRLAGGIYVQPPFYREMRTPDGSLNEGLLAQKSAHILTGLSYDFQLGKGDPKKFKIIAEAYYKKLWDLVSYEVDNVRIQYSGQNDASGYVAGLDFRVNGEFVRDAESWINLSFLRARESLDGIQHLQREVGQEEGTPVKDVPRPTDQAFTVNVFFQDYLRENKNFKVHLNIVVGRGLPFGLKDNNKVYRNTYRLNDYKRVDLGFSYALWNEEKRALKPTHPLRFTKDAWVSFEVFNLLQIENQAGNTWIKTVFNTQYAIPNFLTSRRLNLRFRMEF